MQHSKLCGLLWRAISQEIEASSDSDSGGRRAAKKIAKGLGEASILLPEESLSDIYGSQPGVLRGSLEE